MNTKLPNDYNIGIIGCGHLGRALALACLQNGISKDRLLLSYRGNAQTRDSLAEKGLLDRAVSNGRLFSESDVIFITVRPQDFSAFRDMDIPSGPIFVSLMAGIPLSLLREVFGKSALRMMISGPDTILSGCGIAALYPGAGPLEQLLNVLRVRSLTLSGEDELNVFTAGVCMPAALLQLNDLSESKAAVARLSAAHPMMSELYDWSLGVLPPSLSQAEKDAYIKRMVTKGGITEAVISSLKAHAPLDKALQTGITRVGEISAAMTKSFGK